MVDRLCFLAGVFYVEGSSFESKGSHLIFTCFLQPDMNEIPVVFETKQLSEPSDRAYGLESALSYAESQDAFYPALPSENSRWSVSNRDCEFRTSIDTVTLPVTHFFNDDTFDEISVARVAPESATFSAIRSFSTNYRSPIRGRFEAFLSIRDSRPQEIACESQGQISLSPQLLRSGEEWSVVLENLEFKSNSIADSIRMNHTEAMLSFSTKGIHLPTDMYDSFVSKFAHLVLQNITQVGDSIRVSNCFDENMGVFRGMPSLVLTLMGSHGTGVIITPDMFIEALPNRECLVEVYRSGQERVILGDAFLRTGFVQICRNRGLVLCPRFVLDQDAKMAFNSGASLPGKYDDPSGFMNTILISLTVGGIVLILGVIVFFILRAKRRQQFKNREDPRRFIFQDPSVNGSEISESVPQHRIAV